MKWYQTYSRSSHRKCSGKKGILRNLAKSTGKHLCQRMFLNKVAGLRPATLLKNNLWHRCFPVNFVKFLRTPSLQKTPGRLLLVWGARERGVSVCFGRPILNFEKLDLRHPVIMPSQTLIYYWQEIKQLNARSIRMWRDLFCFCFDFVRSRMHAAAVVPQFFYVLKLCK